MADDSDTSTDNDANDTGQQQDGTVNDQGQQDTQPDNNDAGQQQDDQDQKTDKSREPDLKAELAKWKALARKHETRVKELTPLATKLKEIEDSQKTELEKIKEREAALAVELQRYKVAEVRRAAASAAGLDPEFADFITAADEEEAKEQATKLAERLKASGAKTGPDFKQGTRTSPPPQRTRDELLRGIAGYGPR